MLSKTRTATFIRHYVEMGVVMFAGMLVLGLPGEAALHAIGSGTSELQETAPATVFLRRRGRRGTAARAGCRSGRR